MSEIKEESSNLEDKETTVSLNEQEIEKPEELADEIVEEDADVENEDSETAVEEEPESGRQEQVKPVGRSQARIQRLSAELKTEREDRERLISERATAQAQLEYLRQQQNAVRNESERRAEDERLALLDPQERALYQANNQLRQLEHRLNQMEAGRKDDQDRANFHARAAHDETYSKYAEEIENVYQDGLSRGVSAPREDLLAWRIGKELLANRKQDTEKKKSAASKRIDSVTSKPASARGDVAGSKKGKSVEDRLSGVLI